jgi:stress-induced morphogen
MDVDEHCLEDLSISLEDMDIECSDDDTFKEKSMRMDEKVKEIERKREEKEKLLKDKRINFIEKKKKVEEAKSDLVKNANKKLKQKNKDEKKKLRRKKKNVSISSKDTKFMVPNIEEIPANCKHLVKKDDVLYVVPGDGCCGPNCGAAHLFQDEVYGPQLRKKMNIFMADHWEIKYKYITKCSSETPFVRRLNGRDEKYSDPVELLKFLRESEEAAYMWTDCEDLVVLADMYQINIKVITTKGYDDKNVTENWIFSDPKLEKYAELKNVKLEDMALLHEDNNHFNLIVNKDSDLALLGSLSFRLNLGSLKESRKIDIPQETEPVEKVDFEELAKIKKDWKKCEKDKKLIEQEYFKCENELKIKTEEVEKLKLEIRDLKQIGDLKNDLENIKQPVGINSFEGNNPKDIDVNIVENDEQIADANINPWKKAIKLFNRRSNAKSSSKRKDEKEKEEEEFNCVDCDFQAHSQDQLTKHINLKHVRRRGVGEENHIGSSKRKVEKEKEEEEFHCVDCDFQAHSQDQLTKHINLKHVRRRGVGEENHIECKFCGNKFYEKGEFMTHRKVNHPGTIALCKNYAAGGCPFSANGCWWRHNQQQKSGTDHVDCFICGETFKTRSEMMRHRKLNHTKAVRQCDLFNQNRCRFENNSCWFLHVESNVSDFQDKDEEMCNSQSDFQKSPQNLDPPLRKRQKKQKLD